MSADLPASAPAASAMSAMPPASLAAASSKLPPEDLRANIEKLKQEAQKLKAEKQKVNRALRNAEKKRSRLKRKARELTDADLLQVLKLREDEQSVRDGVQQLQDGGANQGSRRDAQREKPAPPPAPKKSQWRAIVTCAVRYRV